MTTVNWKMRGTAAVALLGLPFAAGTAFAQDTGQTQQQTSQDAMQQQPAQTANGTGQTGGGQQSDATVATVGDAEIRGSDVMAVIGMLPPQLQQQPPQMLVPMALQQLILRELILQEARGQNLAEDPEVIALVESSSQAAQEDAMVQVWLNRQMANVVTDEAVQQTYEAAQAQGQQELPPIEEVRPQIEQQLRQQAMQDIQMRLREGADIVLYDPTGQPIEQQTGQTQQGQGAQNNTGGGSGDQTGDGTNGSANSAGGQTQTD